MRKSVATLFSGSLIAIGLVMIIFVSGSLSGRAKSQTVPAKAAGTNAPEAAPQAPSAAIPTAPSMDNPVEPVDSGVGAGSAKTEAVAVVPGLQNTEGYSYDPTGRRDPFQAFGQRQESAPVPVPIPVDKIGKEMPEVPQVPLAPPEPLQQFDLSQLKVVGIIWEVKSPKAMIKDPLGKLHLVKREAKIGRNNGFIGAIREGEIVVLEPTVGQGGVPGAATRVLSLTR